MKNKYASNSEGELVHIRDVDKSVGLRYYCINCGEELIPRKGKIKEHHFAHKSIENCSYESYLHKLSKRLFYERYKECVEKNIPFYMEYKRKRFCNTCLNIGIIAQPCFIEEKIVVYDLTKVFKNISVERKYGNYIADIILESDSKQDVIFIEIAVTHKCEYEKILSGIRIIELNVHKENDLKFLFKNKIELNNPNLKFFNFKCKIIEDKYFTINSCVNKYHVFVVFKSGKAIIKKKLLKDIYKLKKHYKPLYLEILDDYDDEVFFDDSNEFPELIEKVSKMGIKVLNCNVCRFSVEDSYKFSIGNLFCKKRKIGIASTNWAAECEYFWRI